MATAADPSHQQNAPPPSPSVQGYSLQDRIGRGSYAVVYRAYSNSTHSNGTRDVCAIKCVLKNRICTTRAAQDNLVSEIRLLKQLRHPHIVQLHDFQWDKTYIYLIMEYCNGGDLSGFIRKHKCLSESIAKKFLQQLASAVRYLRVNNISHMDLKPQNILIMYGNGQNSRQPVLKLGDFGFATHMSPWDDQSSNSMRGSPLYMAPEMFNRRTYDASVDLWSIGVILYECLFGKAPFACSTMDELMLRIKSDEEIDIPESIVSEECRDLLRRLLRRHPRDRMTFEEFFDHPFVDLEHAPSEDCLRKATRLIKDAVDLDEAGRTLDAVRIYSRALAYFVPAIQYETDPEKKRILRAKVRQYLKRAEQLKAALMPRKATRRNERMTTDTPRPGSSNSGPSSLTLADQNKDIYELKEAYQDFPEIGAALTVVTKAEELINDDLDDRYEEALEKYSLAIESALKILREDRKMTTNGGGGGRREVLRGFIDRWLKRAGDLKEYSELRKLNLSKMSEEMVAAAVEVNALEETHEESNNVSSVETALQDRACSVM